VGVVGVVAITLLGGHEELLEQSLTRIILTSVGAPLLGLAAVTMVLFGMKSPDWSRLFIFSFTTFSSIGLLAYRLILRSYFRARQRLGFYARNLLLLGSPGALAQVAGRLEGWTEAGAYRLFGYLRLPDMAEADYPPDVLCLGTVEQLDSLLIRFPVHQVLAIEPAAGASWLEKVLRDCDQVGVPVQVLPEALLRFEPTTLRHESAGIGLPGMMLAPPTFNSESLFFKRI